MDAANKSTLYREVNLATEAMLRRFESEEAAQFLCECRDGGCPRRLALNSTEYEAVRESGGYLVSLECVADSDVLYRADGYAAVAFRLRATGGERTPSPSESSGSESSRRESSLGARSPRGQSPRGHSRQELPPRRGALRLVSTAGSPPARPPERSPERPPSWSSPLPGRSWHRRSQSARLLPPPAPPAHGQRRVQLPPAF
jgi:hypothetical protein